MIHIGETLTDTKIETLSEKILEIGYDEWNPYHKNTVQHYTCDGDPADDFFECLQHRTSWHLNEWERRYQDKIESRVEKDFITRLKEEDLYGPPKDLDTTRCGHHLAYEPTVITESNEADIRQCFYDTAHNITWHISESWQIFLQTLNPCEWDNSTPETRYGKCWIPDPETRVTILHWKNSPYHKENYKNIIYNCQYRGHTIRKDSTFFTVYNDAGNIYHEDYR